MKKLVKLSLLVCALAMLFFNYKANATTSKTDNLPSQTNNYAPCFLYDSWTVCYCDIYGYACGGTTCPSVGTRCNWE